MSLSRSAMESMPEMTDAAALMVSPMLGADQPRVLLGDAAPQELVFALEVELLKLRGRDGSQELVLGLLRYERRTRGV